MASSTSTSSISNAISTVGSISSPGLGSGLDVNSIVTQLVSLEKQPIKLLQQDASKMQAQLSSWGQIKSALSTLRDAASALDAPATWTPTTATSSDAASVSATTTSSAMPGSYSVNVVKLASSQSLASQTYSAASSTVGQGSIHIQLGTWGTDPDTGATTFTAGSAAGVDISIGAGEDTLTGIRDKINAANAGVSASIVTDTTGSRLVLHGDSGAANGFQVTVSDSTDGTGNDSAGLSALAYDPSAGIQSMTQTQTAADSEAQINGMTVKSTDNTITSIDGITFTLGKPTSTSISVSINRDTATIAKSIGNFADAYSRLIGLVKDQTKYDSASKTAATLQGDNSAVSVESQFRSLVGTSTGASSVFKTLSEIGLSIQKDGSLSVDSTKLQSALKSNLGEVKKLFANSDSANSNNDGIAQRFRALGDQVLGVDGLVSTRTNGIQSNLNRNSARQSDLSDRAAQYESRLRAQYTALDTQLSKLNSLSSYVTQQLAALNKTSS